MAGDFRMKWFYNMKISLKILLGFFMVAFIAGIIGVEGVLNINKIKMTGIRFGNAC